MQAVTVSALINAPIEQVWKTWTTPEDIENWNTASLDWHCPKAVNNLHVGGKFSYTMTAIDGSFSFDFEGIYTGISEPKYIEYTILDGRKVTIHFAKAEIGTTISETFEIEDTHSEDEQRSGWQSILDKFKQYTESN
ncbi:SRPBCC domain-containing protein [Candidatus Gracilibacteria bacterium]|nr:SRPBCC domain-containing protein [Candidatus Gracilibacteria bacterium]